MRPDLCGLCTGTVESPPSSSAAGAAQDSGITSLWVLSLSVIITAIAQLENGLLSPAQSHQLGLSRMVPSRDVVA